jgi:hypothetical protein
LNSKAYISKPPTSFKDIVITTPYIIIIR